MLLDAATMTAPRRIVPGKFWFLTRRCVQRQFLLTPDKQTWNLFLYCLGVAAHRYGIRILLTQMLSNHHHTVLYDPDARVSEFMAYFHRLVASCRNAHLGRWECLWNDSPPSLVEITQPRDLLGKLLYTAVNPVKDFLVDSVAHWPGPNTAQAFIHGTTLTATRPTTFFSPTGDMPETVELALALPEGFAFAAEFRAELAARITLVEDKLAEFRKQTGRRILGRARVLRQSWRDSPTSREPRRGLRPRIAAKDKWARIQALQRNQDFQRDYKLARKAWLAGLPALFPYGTYWLRRFANVPVAPPPRALEPPLLPDDLTVN